MVCTLENKHKGVQMQIQIKFPQIYNSYKPGEDHPLDQLYRYEDMYIRTHT